MLYLPSEPFEVSPLTRKAVDAAVGFNFFGLHNDAIAELEKIPPIEREKTPVLLVKIKTILYQKKWRLAEKICKKAIASTPKENEFYVQLAFALHKMEREEEAVDTIMSAPESIRRIGILHYNLGCYEARFGNLEIARSHIDSAIKINSKIKNKIKKDPDLRMLWYK